MPQDSDPSSSWTIFFATHNTCISKTRDSSLSKDVDVTMEGHSKAIMHVCTSQNGRMVATGSGDTSIRIWNASHGKVVCEKVLLGHKGAVSALCLSAGGNVLVSSSTDNTIRIWDPRTGDCQKVLKLEYCQVMSLCLNSDASLIYGACDNHMVRIWDVATGNLVKVLAGHSGAVRCVCLDTEDADLLVSGSQDRTIRVWESVHCNRPACKVLQGHTGAVCSLSIMAGAKRLLSGSSDKSVRLWDLNTTTCVRVFHGHAGAVNSVSFHADGLKAMSTSEDKTVRVWNLESSSSHNDCSIISCEAPVKFACFSTAPHWHVLPMLQEDDGDEEGNAGQVCPVRVPRDLICKIVGAEEWYVDEYLSPRPGSAVLRAQFDHTAEAEGTQRFLRSLDALCLHVPSTELVRQTEQLAKSEFHCKNLNKIKMSLDLSKLAQRLDVLMQGGSGQALPLLAARQLWRNLQQLVPGVIKQHQVALEYEQEDLARQQNVHQVVVKLLQDHLDSMRGPYSRYNLGKSLVTCAKNGLSCYVAADMTQNTSDQCTNASESARGAAKDAVLREIKAGSTVLGEAKSALDPLLKRAETSLRAAIMRQETTEGALDRTMDRIKQVREEHLKYLDMGAAGTQEKEDEACNIIIKEQKQALDWAKARKSMLERLVQQLTATATEYSQLLESAVAAEEQASARNEYAQQLLLERQSIHAAAMSELDTARPLEQQLRAMVYKSEQNIVELAKSCELMACKLDKLTSAWQAIKNALCPENGLLGVREAEYMHRILAANVSRLLPDDLRTLLTDRGLGMHWDTMASNGLLPEKISNVLSNSSADGLGDLLTSLGIVDTRACKRVVHAVQLAHFGLDPKVFSEGGTALGLGSEPACCT
jgi:WD40 repeat protein